jgi:putative phosphoribosyl transferase
LIFADRVEAGRVLARGVADLEQAIPVVLGMPRGGVPVAAEIARALRAPLDLIVARKLRTPWQPELAMGAVCEGDPPVTLTDGVLIERLGVREEVVRLEAEVRLAEAAEIAQLYREGRPPIDLVGRTVVVADDGVATGWTIRAAIASVIARRPARVVVAVPVGPIDTIARLRLVCDRVECPEVLEHFVGVGGSYRDFHQYTDSEVLAVLAAARDAGPPLTASGS